MLWRAVARKARVQCRRGRLPLLVALFEGVVGARWVCAHLEAQVEKGLACVCRLVAVQTRDAALEHAAKGAVHDAGAARAWRAVGVRGELVDGVGRVEWEGGEACAPRCVVRKCVVDSVERANEHFVRIVLASLRELGRGVRPDGVEEGRGTIGLAAVAAGEKLGEQLVHFAREAVAARAAQRGIVPIT